MSGSTSERDPAPASPRRRPQAVPVTIAVVLAAGFVILVATLAATTGPTEVFAGPGPIVDRVSAEPTPTPTPEPEGGRESDTERLPRERSSGSLLWIGTVVRGALAVLVAVALIAAAVFYARRRRPRRRTSSGDGDVDADFMVVDPLAGVSEAMVDSAEEQDAALRQGTPRNGIVESWRHFELSAARAGSARAEWETSTEFTVRLLRSVRADPRAVDRLAGLYQLARFSHHEVTELDRVAAGDALAAIQATLTHTSIRRLPRP